MTPDRNQQDSDHAQTLVMPTTTELRDMNPAAYALPASMCDGPLGPPAQCSYEAVVSGVPGEKTTKSVLNALAGRSCVGAVYTVAAQASVMFHLVGRTKAQLEIEAGRLAEAMGLEAWWITPVIASQAGGAKAT